MHKIRYLFLGHPEYGCFISQEKTLTNFDHGDQVHNVVDPGQRSEASPFVVESLLDTYLNLAFPWCGYSINMQDLSITADYTRYHGSGPFCIF